MAIVAHEHRLIREPFLQLPDANGARVSFEDAVLSQLDRLEKKLQAISALEENVLPILARKDARLESIEERLRAIAEAVCTQQDKGGSSAEYSIQTAVCRPLPFILFLVVVRGIHTCIGACADSAPSLHPCL